VVPLTPAPAAPEADFINSVEMPFRIVPNPEDAQRKIAFCIWETRNKDFDLYLRETRMTRAWSKEPPASTDPLHPVTCVSLDDATAYCEWLTNRERKAGLISAKVRYRLPTDYEWSCAAGIRGQGAELPNTRLGQKQNGVQMYYWGKAGTPNAASGNFGLVDDGYPRTAPVGSYSPNQFGLYDVGGNVYEWCSDLSESGQYIVRDASYADSSPAEVFLVSHRFVDSRSTRTPELGFRVVRAELGK
jgi:formylglycine-generating enzyme required for sulfatase activity